MRQQRFTFLCNKDERRLIARLAERLQRSQSDAVRFVVINAAQEICEPNESHQVEGIASDDLSVRVNE